MNSPTAFRATYSDWKLVKTRQVVQIVFEVPLSDADAAYDVLGGMPDFAKETWFGIAAINLSPAEKENNKTPPHVSPAKPQSDHSPAAAKREKMDWRDVQPAAQAGIRCEEPTFKAFLDECHTLAEWNGFTTAEAVRAFCGIKSRAELSTNQKARVIWHQLDSEYQAWLARERVGA